MIPFFRKIRKKLAENNKPLKYLRYAIGEIVLVVIGILIALQVNNWNETRVELKKEKQLLRSLKKEFSDNLLELNYDMKRLDSLQNSLKSLMDILVKEKSESINLDSLIGQTLDSPTWNPSSYVLNDLKNSGKISQLSNLELQEKLFTWEREYENIKENTQDFRHSIDTYIGFLKKNASLRNFDAYIGGEYEIQPSKIGFRSEDLLNNLQFENFIDDYFVATTGLKAEYKDAKNIIKDLISSINL